MNIIHINPRCEPDQFPRNWMKQVGTKKIKTKLIIYASRTWSFKISSKTMEYYPNLKIENHYPIPYLESRLEYYKNNIKLVFHPCITIIIPGLVGEFFSSSLIRELRSSKQVIIHNHRSYMLSSVIIHYFLRHKPLIVEDNGGSVPGFRRKIGMNSPRFLQYFSWFEFFFLNNIDLFRAATRDTADYVFSNYKVKTFHRNPAVDDIFINAKRNVKKGNTFTLIYVGRFDYAKGVDKLLNFYLVLRKKYDLKLICIGGRKNEILYNKVRQVADIAKGRVSKEELLQYYLKSDICVMFSAKGIDKIAGVGAAPLEALASGVPVVSKNLRHFKDFNKVEELGLVPKSDLDYFRSIFFIINNYNNYKDTNKIILENNTWMKTIQELHSCYDVVWSKYYNKNFSNVQI